MWHSLAQGYPSQAVERLHDLELFVGNADKLLSYDHPEMGTAAFQLISIQSRLAVSREITAQCVPKSE
jgi:hypothetical protein